MERRPQLLSAYSLELTMVLVNNPSKLEGFAKSSQIGSHSRTNFSFEVCVCRDNIYMHSAPEVRTKLLHSTLMSRPKDHLCVKFLIAVSVGLGPLACV